MLLSDRISNQLTQICIDNHVIESGEKEIYHYCFSYFFDILLYNMNILLLGLLLHRPFQAKPLPVVHTPPPQNDVRLFPTDYF